ncbi:intracellular protein transport protein USO1-like [Orbicella faveolata]|uniref:intracellular protein transport protein USO1-like n=1 Tax=Orbicella faveolata TaxID=48498 RepID=UPI0009E4D726|nr:intracellular protein transport protein USO1-like [Orbicella faveolata]
MNAEMKKTLDVQTTVKETELKLIKNQLEEKNKEFYDLRVANTTQDMSLRDAQFKIKDLENSLKNEITLHQSIARRNDQLQKEITVLRERNKNEITTLKKSLNDAIGRWETNLHDKCCETSRVNCMEKMDNKTIQKLRELYFKVSELETQLNQERNDHLLSLAQVQEEGRRYRTGELRTE